MGVAKEKMMSIVARGYGESNKYVCSGCVMKRNIGVRPHEIHIKKIKQNQKFYKRNIKYLVKAYHK